MDIMWRILGWAASSNSDIIKQRFINNGIKMIKMSPSIVSCNLVGSNQCEQNRHRISHQTNDELILHNDHLINGRSLKQLPHQSVD